MKNNIKDTHEKEVTIQLLKRFDIHFGDRNDEITQELRKYIENFYTLTISVDAFVPRLFVMWFDNSSYLTPCVVWTVNIRCVFPPVESVVLCKIDRDRKKSQLFGYLKRERLVQELSPYLYDLNGYKATKILQPEYSTSPEILEKLINISSPMDYFKQLVPVDLIPRFEEEQMMFGEDRFST
jgi:hypothetical protein